jgi:hypothetical protein
MNKLKVLLKILIALFSIIIIFFNCQQPSGGNHGSGGGSNHNSSSSSSKEQNIILTVDPGDAGANVGQDNSIAVYGTNIYISYFDLTNYDLKFAKSIDGGETW